MRCVGVVVVMLLAREAAATCWPGPEVDLMVGTRDAKPARTAVGNPFDDVAFACRFDVGRVTRVRTTQQRLTVEEQSGTRWTQIASLPAPAGHVVSHRLLGELLLVVMHDGNNHELHAIRLAGARHVWSITSVANFSSGSWYGCHDLGDNQLAIETTTGARFIDRSTGADIAPELRITTGSALAFIRHAGWLVQGPDELVRISDAGAVIWRHALTGHPGPAGIVRGKVMLAQASGRGLALTTLALATGKRLAHRVVQVSTRLSPGPARVAATTKALRVRARGELCGH